MRFFRTPRLILLALLVPVAGCGGNVVVDASASGHGGASGTGGAASSSTSSSTSSTSGGCPSGTCTVYAGGPCVPPDGPKYGCCRCAPDGTCALPCKCAAPDTPIATPTGERAIASLRPGDLVYSVDRMQVVVVPVVRVNESAVSAGYRVVRVRLANGATLDVSATHPTLDGRSFGDLRAGGALGGVGVLSAELVPYGHDRTFDILPASDTGAYFAGGALIGSTLKPAARLDP
jgi:hypothetical protein